MHSSGLMSAYARNSESRESCIFSFNHLILYTALHKRVLSTHSLVVFATLSHDCYIHIYIDVVSVTGHPKELNTLPSLLVESANAETQSKVS